MYVRLQIENSGGDVREVRIPLLPGDETGYVDVINGKTRFPIETFSLSPENCITEEELAREPVGV